MNRYQKLMIAVIFLLLCSYSMMLGHGAGLLGFLILPALAIVSTLIVKMLIDEIYNAQHHEH